MQLITPEAVMIPLLNPVTGEPAWPLKTIDLLMDPALIFQNLMQR